MWQQEDYRNEMCKKISEAQKKNMNSPERKAKQKEIMLRNWKDKDISEKMINAPKKSFFTKRGWIESNKFNTKLRYDSTGEKEFILACENLDYIKTLSRCDLRLNYFINSEEHIYIPDFKVTTDSGDMYIVEIKFDEEVEENKLKYALKYCKENNINYVLLRRFKELPKFANGTHLQAFKLC